VINDVTKQGVRIHAHKVRTLASFFGWVLHRFGFRWLD